MAGILQSLEIARKALWAAQTGLDVTSNNISNVNTPGYSRQRVELAPSSPVNLGFGPIGTGVLAKRITRARFSMIDRSIRDAHSELGYNKAQETILMQLDGVFNEPGENGLANLISDFFNEWSNVAANPEDTSARQMLLQKSMKMAAAFRDTTNKIYTMKKNIEAQAEGDIKELNNILKDIANLNRKIVNSEIGGAQANDLRDERDLLLDKLAEFGKVNAVEDSRGSMNVTLEGVTVISGTDHQELIYKIETDVNGRKQLNFKLKSTGDQFVARTGKLGSYVYQFNELLPEQQEKLDQIAKTIIDEVNKVHAKSYGLPQGNPPVATTGYNFFGGGSAGTIKVNPNIVEDVKKIALSVSGEPGDAEAALIIANIANQKLFGNHTQTISEFYQTMVSDLGFKIDDTQSNIHHQELLVSQLESQRDAVSGVNLDEEMINLTRFQRAFEAASKVVKTVDEMMQTIINMK